MDFTKREGPGQRFTADVPAGYHHDYLLDAGKYVRDLWNAGPSAGDADFPMGRVIHSSRGVGFTGWIGGVAV